MFSNIENDETVDCNTFELSRLDRLYAGIGRCMMVLSIVPRYRHLSLVDISTIFFEPCLRNKVIIASPKEADKSARTVQPVAIVIWARVSEAVGRKIEEQIRAGIFPIRLTGQEWESGDQVWLLDIIAPSQIIATELFSRFGQMTSCKEAKIHPIVQTLVDNNTFNSQRNSKRTSSFYKFPDQPNEELKSKSPHNLH